MTHIHNHDHEHGNSAGMDFEEKITALLRHWIDHNSSHRANYRSWAEKARLHHLESVAAGLDEAAEISDKITETLEAALAEIKG